MLVNSAGATRRKPPDSSPRALARRFRNQAVHLRQHVQPGVETVAARGRGVIVDVVGNGGKLAAPPHLAGARGQLSSDAAHNRSGVSLRRAWAVGSRRQFRADAHRPGCRGHAGRGGAAGHWRRRRRLRRAPRSGEWPNRRRGRRRSSSWLQRGRANFGDESTKVALSSSYLQRLPLYQPRRRMRSVEVLRPDSSAVSSAPVRRICAGRELGLRVARRSG